MTSYSLSNILLPAVFVSSAVFTTLTVPFALIKSESVVVELPPFFSGEIQPIFNGEHKEVAIPYVGFAIVVSVGAGIATVEVNRRWQAYRESAIAQEPSTDLNPNSKEQEASNLAEYRPEASAIDLPLIDEALRSQALSTSNLETEVNQEAVEATELPVDTTPLAGDQLTLPFQTLAISTVSDKLNLSSSLQENNSKPLVSFEVASGAAVWDLDLTFSKILESREHYQTCRIKVPYLKRRLFAILVNGEYYSFFKAEPTKEKVLEIMAKLGDRLEKTVITKTEKGYVIWNWEPKVS
jgi:hypothetical protein